MVLMELALSETFHKAAMDGMDAGPDN